MAPVAPGAGHHIVTVEGMFVRSYAVQAAHFPRRERIVIGWLRFALPL
jgi:hypothetical protein